MSKAGLPLTAARKLSAGSHGYGYDASLLTTPLLAAVKRLMAEGTRTFAVSLPRGTGGLMPALSKRWAVLQMRAEMRAVLGNPSSSVDKRFGATYVLKLTAHL